MARKSAAIQNQPADPERTAQALAKAMADGDIVNFRTLFEFYSPARDDSTESFDTDKYSHLTPGPGQQEQEEFRACMELVKRDDIWAHLNRQLSQRPPAQMPASLILRLADNAVAHGKYSSAAQAYELLRIRPKMQEQFFEQADTALDNGDIRLAVDGYWAASCLAYDYAAFPEPMPAVPNYQTRALMLHGEYPRRPEDSVAAQEPERHVQTALSYLLVDPELANRLADRPLAQRVAFVRELVMQTDPDWPRFAEHYAAACDVMQELGGQIQRKGAAAADDAALLVEEIEEQAAADPAKVMAKLLGRTIENGMWWQYLKEIAYEHPAAALFVARQLAGDQEIIVPRYRADSPLVDALGLTNATPANLEVMGPQMGIVLDTHLHTNRYSACSHIDPAKLLRRAVRVGLQGIVITEHHRQWTDEELQELVAKSDVPGFILLAGFEYTTARGDLLVYGLQSDQVALFAPGLAPAEAVARFHDLGATCVAAHPTRADMGFDTDIFALPLDAVEVGSVNLREHEQRLALTIAEHAGLPGITASDAHQMADVGRYAMEFFVPIGGMKDLQNALRDGRFKCRGGMHGVTEVAR